MWSSLTDRKPDALELFRALGELSGKARFLTCRGAAALLEVQDRPVRTSIFPGWGACVLAERGQVEGFTVLQACRFTNCTAHQLRYWDQIGLVLVVSVGAALLMTILPARQAAKLTPAEALREA